MKNEYTFRPVRPISPAAAYIGGKKQLASALVERIAKVPHTTYAEGFVGMGGVFFRRKSAPKAEVINDYSGDVATFFRVLQRHYVPFMEMLKWQLASRKEFERLKATDPTTLTDLERAARFLYLQRTAFGGKVAGRNFGVSVDRPSRFDTQKLGTILEDIHERLSGVTIEALDFEAFIDRYDRPETLFFFDPPYWGSEGDYGADMFRRADFERLAKRLKQLKGHFILTINDRPEVRQVFKGFDFEEVELNYSIASTGSTKARELFISN